MEGLTYPRIAAREGCSLPGVGYNVQLIYREYAVHSRGELVERVKAECGMAGDQRPVAAG